MASTINFLRLLTDPTRLRLILLLEQEELSVAELQDVLGMGQSRISSHLAQLKRAGVVEDRRAGKNVYYGLTNGQKLDPQRARVSELPASSANAGTGAIAPLKVMLRRQDKARDILTSWRAASGGVPGAALTAGAHDDRAPPPLAVADLGAGGERSQVLQKSAQSHRVR
jgi:ArsR family transcriptional regulator